jgi:squalene-hopene/tetraprenyl-beta-curcumene cyclase
VLPYALPRPELGATLHEDGAPSPERKLVGDVVTRVLAWSEVEPWYGNATPKGRLVAEQSRGSESVLNALVLARRDQATGTVSAEARQAFANMWAQQVTTGDQAGSWPWINFQLRPWESPTAPYFGAALAAIAVGMEPHGYAQSPEIQPNLDRLRTYLKTHVDQSLWDRVRRHDDPSLFNRAMLLWASAGLPNLLSADDRAAMVSAVWAAQNSDGGWSLTTLGRWQHYTGVPETTASDGYATGLVAYALERAGAEPSEPHLARALAWLAQHQDPESGGWVASSLNKLRDPATDIGKFMSDAATAYAVLALSAAHQ